MHTGKISLFLIIIFSVLSILFYSLYVAEADKIQRLSDEFLDAGIENLALHDVLVNSDVILREIPDKDIFVFEDIDFEKNNSKIADVIVDTAFDEDSITIMSFDVPSGVSLVIHDKSDSSKELARVTYSYNDASFKFTRNGVNVTGTENPVFNNRQSEMSPSLIDKVTSVAQKISSQNTSFRISGVLGEENMCFVTLVKTVDKIDIKDIYINFVFHQDTLVAVQGHWFIDYPVPEYHNTLIDGLNVLYKLDFASVNEIKNERLMYSLQKAENNRYFLLPVWEITYLDKSGSIKTSYIDAL